MTPSVLEYQDYRIFLKDLYQERKTSRTGYSYRRFASDLGFTPSNYFHLVITGKRNLSQDAIGKIKTHLKWTAPEKKFFDHLVANNQDADSTEHHKIEMEKILGKHRKLVHPDQYAYFSNWYIPVLREILALKNFVSELDWIMHKLMPRVEKKLVKEALHVLARLKMIVKTGGRWIQTDSHLSTPPEIASELVRNYHREMIRLSALSLDLPAEKRDVSAMTMGLTTEQFQALKQKLVEFRDEIQRDLQSSTAQPTFVAQLNMQFFPVTEE